MGFALYATLYFTQDLSLGFWDPVTVYFTVCLRLRSAFYFKAQEHFEVIIFHMVSVARVIIQLLFVEYNNAQNEYKYHAVFALQRTG